MPYIVAGGGVEGGIGHAGAMAVRVPLPARFRSRVIRSCRTGSASSASAISAGLRWARSCCATSSAGPVWPGKSRSTAPERATGTSARRWTAGARAELSRRGYDGSSHEARQIQASWLHDYDLVLAMDRANLASLRRMADGDGDLLGRIQLMRSFDPDAPAGAEVPDPYNGRPEELRRGVRAGRGSCQGTGQPARGQAVTSPAGGRPVSQATADSLPEGPASPTARHGDKRREPYWRAARCFALPRHSGRWPVGLRQSSRSRFWQERLRPARCRPPGRHRLRSRGGQPALARASRRRSSARRAGQRRRLPGHRLGRGRIPGASGCGPIRPGAREPAHGWRGSVRRAVARRDRRPAAAERAGAQLARVVRGEPACCPTPGSPGTREPLAQRTPR